MSDRCALVTGGNGGLGAAVARRLAQDGVTVIVGDLLRDAVEAAAQDIVAAGGKAIGVALDITDERSVAGAYAQIGERFGGLDILVNNAGVSGVRLPLEDMPLGDWDRTLRVNLTGAFLMCRGAIPLMKQRKGGRIVNVASQAARGPTGAGKAQYAASKAGMLGLSRVLAEELGPYGITVNCVAPSRTVTPMTLVNAQNDPSYYKSAIEKTPLGRLASPEDSANAVAFLCSEQASFITGAIIDVTGGAFMP